jgi:hypothetical protein
MQSPDWIQASCLSLTDASRKLIPIWHPTKYRPSPSLGKGLGQSSSLKHCYTGSLPVWLLVRYGLGCGGCSAAFAGSTD